MNISLGLIPFKDYWLNCSFNMMFSIFISAEPSFRLAAYVNDYSYQISEIETPPGTKLHCLTLSPMKNFEKKYFNQKVISKQPISFKERENYVDYLKNLVSEQSLVTVGVDLFYWIPDSVCWNKHHWEHYSIITGFNNQKNSFYVFDENINGYDEFEIPVERFCTAVKNSPLDPHGYIYKLSNNIGSFEFSLEEVISNAKRLSKDLKAMTVHTLWELSDEDLAGMHMRDLFSIYLYQIANRQKANQFLFKALNEKKIINDTKITDLFIKYSKDLQNGWLIAKSLLEKAYITRNRKNEIISLNNKCKDLFLIEHEMWNEFLSYIEM